MRTLLSALYANAAEGPYRPALLFVKRQTYVQFTYEDLLAETERWAARFAGLQLAAGSVVAIVLDHRIEMYPAFLGAMRAGLVPSFLPYPTPKQQPAAYWDAQAGLFERLLPGAVVTYGALLENLRRITQGFACELLDVDGDFPDVAAPLPPLEAVEGPRHLALLQHSSGTTGAKKGVALTFEAIRDQTEAHREALGALPSDRVVSWLPLYHDMGLCTAFLFPVALGSGIVSIDAFEWLARPALFLELIEHYRATHAWLPNFAFAHLVRTHDPARRYDLSSLRALVNSSEPCKPATFASFLATYEAHGLAPTALRCSYAMAEAVFACTLTRAGAAPKTLAVDAAELATGNVVTAPAGRSAEFLSCGKPLAGLELRIAAPNGADVGEIQIRGRFVFDRYFRNEAATAAAFEHGWYRTGDTGFLYEGELYVCGRLKEMLIVHGQNFYANDIEAIVNGVAGVKPGRTAVFGRYDETTASEEAVVLAESDALDEAGRADLARAIRAAVYDGLALTVRHVELFPAGALVKTTSGKMSRAENERLFERAEASSQA
jgi:acyl-CoA synthetase (AMP-forming)/AMP-acid ligase II